MGAPWSAIIQAIDHAAGRTASAGKQAQSGATVGGQQGMNSHEGGSETPQAVETQQSETPVAENAPGSNQASGSANEINTGAGSDTESSAGGQESGTESKGSGISMAQIGDKIQSTAGNVAATAKGISSMQAQVPQPVAFSDSHLKNVFGADCPIDCFARVHSYVFKYKPQAQRELMGRNGIDNDVHYGVMAQELEENPFTRSTVHTDPVSGYKTVDTAELTMANTAAIADIMKELQELREFKRIVLSRRGF